MTEEIQYPKRQYAIERGKSQTTVPPKAFDATWLRYKRHHKKLFGYEPTLNDFNMTNALQHNDTFRYMYQEEEEKGPKYAAKYLDGIKTTKGGQSAR